MKDAMRQTWKSDRPDEYEDQEKRRHLWLDAKKVGKVAKASIVRADTWVSEIDAGNHDQEHQQQYLEYLKSKPLQQKLELWLNY
jgi:hypothetical protein